MDHKQRLKRLANIGRMLALLCTCMAVAVVLLWMFAPDRVNGFDEWIKSKYVKPYASRFEQAVKHFKDGKTAQGVEQLGSLLEDMAHVKKRDRLDPVKRNSLKVLSGKLYAAKEYAMAEVYYDQWLAFDEKDLNAHFGKIRLMHQQPENKSRGRLLLLDLLHKFPARQFLMPYIKRDRKNPDLAGLYLSLDGADRRPSGLALAFVDWMRNKDDIRRNWKIFYFKGQAYGDQDIQTAPMAWTDRFKIGFSTDLTRETRAVFIAPPGAHLIVKPLFQIKKGSGASRTEPSGIAFQSRGLAEPWEDIFLVFRDVTPAFSCRIPDREKTGQTRALSFQTLIFPAMFLHIPTMDLAESVRDELAETAGTAMADTFLEAWSEWRRQLPADIQNGKPL
jgi:hypothetical protein